MITTGRRLVLHRHYPTSRERVWLLLTAPAGREQTAFMEQAGMPLSTCPPQELVDVDEPTRLAYTSTIDFIAGVAPYQHLTVVTLDRVPSGTDVTMEIEPLHDDVWTERLRAVRAHELDNLARVIASARLHGELRRY